MNQDPEIQAVTPVVTNPEVVVTPSVGSNSKKLITEPVTGYKLVRRSSDNSEVYLITTSGNKEVWVPKAQFDTSAETITFSPVKKGDTWRNSKTGATGVYQSDAYQFVTCGKRDAVDTKTQVLKNLLQAGFNPTISI